MERLEVRERRARKDRAARFLAAALELYQLDPARFEAAIAEVEALSSVKRRDRRIR